MQYKYRQGDVDIFVVEHLPKNLRKIKGATLAYGEVTGHHHTLYRAEPQTKIELFEGKSNEFLKEVFAYVQGGRAILKHQEHTPIVLEPAVHVVRIEKELDPYLEKIRTVLD